MREHEIGRVENGRLITPSEREYKSITISNPTNEQLKFLKGYRDIDKGQVALAEIPEYDEKTQIVIKNYFYNEDTKKINVEYIVEDKPSQEFDFAEEGSDLNE